MKINYLLLLLVMLFSFNAFAGDQKMPANAHGFKVEYNLRTLKSNCKRQHGTWMEEKDFCRDPEAFGLPPVSFVANDFHQGKKYLAFIFTDNNVKNDTWGILINKFNSMYGESEGVREDGEMVLVWRLDDGIITLQSLKHEGTYFGYILRYYVPQD